jgi:hypothetical protein
MGKLEERTKITKDAENAKWAALQGVKLDGTDAIPELAADLRG